MSDEGRYTIRPDDSLSRSMAWLRAMIERGLQGGELVVMFKRPRRSTEQNRKLWAMLRDVARQIPLTIDGEMVWADETDWKDVFTAAYRRETRVARGLNGGVVMLGMRTSQMSQAAVSDLIEMIYAYGSEWGVEWSEPADGQGTDAPEPVSPDPLAKTKGNQDDG